jgi:hypothetical protein
MEGGLEIFIRVADGNGRVATGPFIQPARRGGGVLFGAFGAWMEARD